VRDNGLEANDYSNPFQGINGLVPCRFANLSPRDGAGQDAITVRIRP